MDVHVASELAGNEIDVRRVHPLKADAIVVHEPRDPVGNVIVSIDLQFVNARDRLVTDASEPDGNEKLGRL